MEFNQNDKIKSVVDDFKDDSKSDTAPEVEVKRDNKDPLKEATSIRDFRSKIQNVYLSKSLVFTLGAISVAVMGAIFSVLSGWGEHKRRIDSNPPPANIAKEVEENKTKFDAGISSSSWQGEYEKKIYSLEGIINQNQAKVEEELNKTNQKIDSLAESVKQGLEEAKKSRPSVEFLPERKERRKKPKEVYVNNDFPVQLPPKRETAQDTTQQQSGFFDNTQQQNLPNTQQQQQQQPEKQQKYIPQQVAPSSPYASVRIESVSNVNQSQKNSGLLANKVNNQKKQQEDDDAFYILNGVGKGLLVTGISAPTDDAGAANPVPAMIVVNDDVIQPNDERSRLDGCFILGTATGNLSSHRVDIRFSTLSCVVKRGKEKKRIEQKVEGWVYSRDGMNGLPGRLVTRTGQELARVLAAGFLQGVASAFAPTSNVAIPGVGTIETVQQDATLGQKLNTGMKDGLYSGTQNALNMLAQYYMNLANKQFPVVEVKGNQEVGIIFKGGTSIKTEPHKTLNVEGYR